MEQTALIKNKANGVTYTVTHSQWETIKNSMLATAYEMVKGFPPVVSLDDLPEVQEITDSTEEIPAEEPNTPPAAEDEITEAPAEELPVKTGKKKNVKG